MVSQGDSTGSQPKLDSRHFLWINGNVPYSPSHEKTVQAAELLSTDQPEEALRLLEPVLEQSPSHAGANATKARICYVLGRTNEAQTHYLAAKAINSSIVDPELELLIAQGLQSPPSAPDPQSVSSAESFASHSQAPPRLPKPGEPTRRSGFTTALLSAIAIHAVIVVLLGLFVIVPFVQKAPPLVIRSIEEPSPDEIEQIAFERLIQPKPTSPSSRAAPVLTAVAASNLAAPDIDVPVLDPFDMGVGTGLGHGDGFGSGAGSGDGFGVQFFGNETKARSVVFVVDASASLNADRQAVMRKELSRAVNGLDRNMLYQIIFFSGPAWAHDRFGTKPRDMRKGIRKYEHQEFNKMYREGKYKPVKLRRATTRNLRESLEIIENIPMSFGTRWSPGIQMALLCDPAPDIIYFMTDGSPNRNQEDLDDALERIKVARKESGNKSKIYATALMAPSAAKQMDELAKACRGEFNVVMPGKDDKLMLIKGRDWLRGKRRGKELE